MAMSKNKSNTEEASDPKVKKTVKKKVVKKEQAKKPKPINMAPPYAIWVGRDKGGALRAFAVEPQKEKVNKQYTSKDLSLFDMKLPQDWFPKITYESGPVRLTLDYFISALDR